MYSIEAVVNGKNDMENKIVSFILLYHSYSVVSQEKLLDLLELCTVISIFES